MPPLVGSMNGGDIHRLYDKYKELILIIDVSRGWGEEKFNFMSLSPEEEDH